MLNVKQQQVVDNAWRFRVDSYAEHVSGGKWKPYDWIVFALRIVQAEIRKGNARVIVNAPPRQGKSEGLSHWLPTWFLDWFPEKRVIAASYGDRQATKWSRMVRDEFSAAKKDNPTWTRVRSDHHLAQDWGTTDGGGMRAVGVGGSILGEGGDLVVVDDIHKNWEEAQSAAARRRVTDWFDSTLMSRLEPGASVILVQHRWHPRDLCGYLTENFPDDWVVLSFPAIAEENDILGRAPGEALCPERFDESALAARERETPHVKWCSLWQQRPELIEGGVIKRSWFRYYDQLPPGVSPHAQSWDLPFEGEETSTRAAGGVWAKNQSGEGDNQAHRYLIDVDCDHMDFNEQLGAIRTMSQKWPEAVSKVIEKKANGAAVIATLDDEIPGIEPYNPRGSKAMRLVAVSPFFKSGNIWLPNPRTHPWVEDYVDEVCAFPKGTYDDCADMTSQYLDWDRGSDDWDFVVSE